MIVFLVIVFLLLVDVTIGGFNISKLIRDVFWFLIISFVIFLIFFSSSSNDTATTKNIDDTSITAKENSTNYKL
ncbi:putative membrane protein [Francisella philomiragia subsp. philomiragia ATCC 25015]|nr:putative membrane protein [Francisella philomiragia subsp. philomiragia ATCC 25015]